MDYDMVTLYINVSLIILYHYNIILSNYSYILILLYKISQKFMKFKKSEESEKSKKS